MVEGFCDIIYFHIIQLEYNTDDTGNKTHYEELGSNFRDIVAFAYNAPDRPYHAGSDREENKLVAECERRHLFAVLCEFFSIFFIRLIRNGELRIFLDLYRVAHREDDRKSCEEDP